MVNFIAFITFSILESPRYLSNAVSTAKRAYITRNNEKLPHFKLKHNNLKNYFFLSTVIEYDKLEWNKLNLSIRNSKFRNSLVLKVTVYLLPEIVSFFAIIQRNTVSNKINTLFKSSL